MFQGITESEINFAFYRQVGFNLQLVDVISADEIDGIKKTQKNIVIVSTSLSQMSIPTFLDLNAERIKADGFNIEHNCVAPKIWAKKNVNRTSVVREKMANPGAWDAP